MKIRSLDDLNHILSEELAWRKKELSEIKSMVEMSALPKHRKNVLIRASIAMIYAHWEGFLKLAGRYYLEYIASLRLKNSELSNNFLAISFGASCRSLLNPRKFSSYASVATFFEDLEKRAQIPFKTIIDTESNLSSRVLKEIVWCLDLSYNSFEIKEKIIDEKMLAKRNYIAHGEYLEVDEGDVISLRDEILDLMINFKDQIENSALTKGYLKKRNDDGVRYL